MKVFLSHATADKPLVRKIHEMLGKENSWLDEVDIENGDMIPEKIGQGLKTATHFVLFWSERASKSRWVEAEMNAAFMRYVSAQCKFMIFVLDGSTRELNPLYQPFKYDISNSAEQDNINEAAKIIVSIISSGNSNTITKKRLVGRYEELNQIENKWRDGVRLIILSGILGIGKAAISHKVGAFLRSESAELMLDFSRAAGPVELYLQFISNMGLAIPQLINPEDEKDKIEEILESAAENKRFLILRDVKTWLTDEGKPGEYLKLIFDRIVDSDMFTNNPVVVTSSRFIDLPYTDNYISYAHEIRIKGMPDEKIKAIICDNLPYDYESQDESKLLLFAKRLHGYPLGAKMAARLIEQNSLDYYIKQDFKIKDLNIGLAKELVSYSVLGSNTEQYLRILALAQSSLQNAEYAEAFSKDSMWFSKCSDDAYNAGLVYYNADDGCYKLEHIIEDYYFNTACDASDRDYNIRALLSYMKRVIQERLAADNTRGYLRILSATMHLLILNDQFPEAVKLRSDMIGTIQKAMWDQYRHRQYENADKTAVGILKINENNFEANYVHELCLIREELFDEAKQKLKELLRDYPDERRCYYASARLEQAMGNYEEAIVEYKKGLNINSRYSSCHRGIAECFLFLGDTVSAEQSINNAIKYDSSNYYSILVKCKILEAMDRIDDAIDILEKETVGMNNNSQLRFRLGHLYSLKGDISRAESEYREALKLNPNEIDAEISLLSIHVTVDKFDSDEDGILQRLKERGNRKRKAILINIEARNIGYNQKKKDEAIELLDTVGIEFRDRQWYAVKLRLMELCVEDKRNMGMKLIAKQIENNISIIKDEAIKRFGNDFDKTPEYAIELD